jgi:starch phosphorylase
MYPDLWKIVSDREIISDEEIWSLRYTLRRELVEFARKQLRGQYQRVGGDGARIFERILSPDALTIGFARRFATYASSLIFRDMAKAVSLSIILKDLSSCCFPGCSPRDDKGRVHSTNSGNTKQ